MRISDRVKKRIRILDLHSGLAAALFAALLFLIVSPPSRICAQAPRATPAPLSNRYLFIVETSRSMRPRKGAALQAVQDLLGSGMKGQLRPGDTIGLWTFNRYLYAGRFPLQQWSPEAWRTVPDLVLTFLNNQKYEKLGRLDSVLPTMDRLIEESDFITVLLISDGAEPIHGTPFDAQINEAYKLWRKGQQKVRTPFVTVLRAKGGQIMDFKVNPASWPVELPPLPSELLAAPPKKPEIVLLKPQPVPQPVMAAPLILSGRKTEAEKIAPVQPESLKAKTGDSAPTSRVGSADTSLAAPEKQGLETTIKPLPTMAPLVESKAETAKTLNLKPEPVVVEQPKPSATAPAVAAPAPQPLSAPGKSAATSEASSGSGSAPFSPAVSNLAASSSTVPPIQSGVVVPPQSPLDRRTIWIAGIILVRAFLALAILMLRRLRPASRGSLITHSLERDKK